MARTSRVPRELASRKLGHIMGESLSAGIEEGIQQAFAELQSELLPLGDAVIGLLRRETEEAAKETAALVAMDEARVCATPGCGRRPVARGMCRRHYARKVYQERKERTSEATGTAPVRRVRSVTQGEAVSVDKKNVNAVAPIVRRRKGENETPAPAAAEAPVAANGGSPGTVNVADVARFFGLK